MIHTTFWDLALLPEDGRRAKSGNVVCIKYTSDNGQGPTQQPIILRYEIILRILRKRHKTHSLNKAGVTDGNKR
jgi:hypothetical protein